MFSRRCICTTSRVASLSAMPGARLKETVTDGKRLVWFTDSGMECVLMVATVLSGTLPAFAEFM